MQPKSVKLSLILISGAAIILALFTRQAAAQPLSQRSGRSASVLTSAPAISLPGDRLIFAETEPRAELSTIWLASAADPTQRAQIASTTHAVGYPPTGAVSPAGDRIAFFTLPPAEGPTRARTDGNEIWLATLDGSPATRLATGAGFFGHWSPDGAWLTFGRLVALDPPNGPHIYYRTEIYRLSAQDGASNLILADEQDYSLYPLGWAPAGDRYLVALVDTAGAWRVEARDPASGALLQTWILPPYQLPRRFSLAPDALSLLVEDIQSGQAILSIFDLSGQRAQAQSVLSSAPIDDQYPVSPAAALWSPDGQTLWVYRQPQAGASAAAQLLSLDAATESPARVLQAPLPGTLLLPESSSPDAQWRSWRLYPQVYTTRYIQRGEETALTQVSPRQAGNWLTFLGWSFAPGDVSE